MVTTAVAGDVAPYCTSMGNEAGPYFAAHYTEMSIMKSPILNVNLINFLSNRFANTYKFLTCDAILGGRESKPIILGS